MKRSPLRKISKKRAAKIKLQKQQREYQRESGQGYQTPSFNVQWADGSGFKIENKSVTEIRAAGTAKQKLGEMRSVTLRRYVVKSADCQFCDHRADELHHNPTTGSFGTVNDLLALPVCRRCHENCHTGYVAEDDQRSAVAGWWRYLAEREPGVFRQALKEMLGP